MSRASKTDITSSKHKKIFKPQAHNSEAQSSNFLPFCYFHTENKIIKFCQCKQCTLPLCNECQPIHLEEHSKNYTHPDISDYAIVRQKIISQLQKRISQYENNTQRNKQLLMEQKARIQNIINDFFRTLTDKFIQDQNTKVIVAILDEKLEKIKRGSIKALIQYCSGEGVPEIHPIPNFEIINNDQGLLGWLKNAVRTKDNKVIKSEINQQIYSRPPHIAHLTHQVHQPPHQVLTNLPIATKPLVQNIVTVQPNLPISTQPVYQQKRDFRYEVAQPAISARRQLSSVLRVQNSKQNQLRSQSPKMPAIQKFKSKNVLRNSCQLVSSPIKQLSIDVSQNPTNRHQQNFNPVSQERFNQTFSSNTDKRSTSVIGYRPPSSHNLIRTDGFQHFNPMIHQRDPSPQIVVQPQIIRPHSSYSTENLMINHNMNSHRVVQPVIIQDQQINRNIQASINSVNKSIQGQKKVLTPDELQNMIVNKKSTQQINYGSRPSLFSLAAQQKSHNIIGQGYQDIRSQSPPKDFWRADSYFQQQQQLTNNAPQGGYQIKISQPPKQSANGFYSTTDSYPINGQGPLKMEDLMSKARF